MAGFYAIAIGWLVFAFLLGFASYRWERYVHAKEQPYDWEVHGA